MPSPSRSPEPLATSQQAEQLVSWLQRDAEVRLGWSAEMVASGRPIPELPSAVALHVPKPDSLSLGVTNSLDAYQERGYGTHKTPARSVVGSVLFTQTEHRDKDLRYATHVNYYIMRDDAVLDWERRVAATEHGSHKSVEQSPEPIEYMTIGDIARFEELRALSDKIEQTRPLERALGLLAVTYQEAQAVIDFCNGLHSA